MSNEAMLLLPTDDQLIDIRNTLLLGAQMQGDLLVPLRNDVISPGRSGGHRLPKETPPPEHQTHEAMSDYDNLILRAEALDIEDDNGIVGELVEAIQELEDENAELVSDVDDKEARIKELEEEVAEAWAEIEFGNGPAGDILRNVRDEGASPGLRACLEVALGHARDNYAANSDEVIAIEELIESL